MLGDVHVAVSRSRITNSLGINNNISGFSISAIEENFMRKIGVKKYDHHKKYYNTKSRFVKKYADSLTSGIIDISFLDGKLQIYNRFINPYNKEVLTKNHKKILLGLKYADFDVVEFEDFKVNSYYGEPIYSFIVKDFAGGARYRSLMSGELCYVAFEEKHGTFCCSAKSRKHAESGVLSKMRKEIRQKLKRAE